MSNLIINIEGLDFEKSNITFVNGMSLEKVRIKYPWLLNAKVKDVIIGEDDYGLIWYSGEWICGEWIDGTWYSGTFLCGNWNNGKWYSYKLNKFDIISEKFIIEENGPEFSIFKNGLWLNGIWNGGTFGDNIIEDWEDFELYRYLNTDYLDTNTPNFRKLNTGGTYDEKNISTWMNGEFNQGIFQNAIWDNGVFNNGEVKNSKWLSGNFYFGIFNGDTWYNGNWYNGDFIKGKWLNGVFTKLNPDIISRFGAVKENILETVCEWFGGEWKNGDWFSGYNIINDTEFSYNNKISIWYNGIWRNGTWFGGHFKSGDWYNGLWKDGIYGNIIQSIPYKPKNVYEWIDDNKYRDLIYFSNDYLNNSGLTNLGSYWSGSTSGDLSSTSTFNDNDYYEQKYIDCYYETQYGGWDISSPFGINDSGITYDSITSAITLYVRDGYIDSDYDNWDSEKGYVDSDNNYIPRVTPKKRNFTYELMQTNILDIGGSGFTISPATYITGTTKDISYKVGTEEIPIWGGGTMIINKYIKSKNYTKIILNETGSVIYNKLKLLSDKKIKIYNKELVKYENGNGIDRTYINFEKIINKDGKMTFISYYPIDASYYEIDLCGFVSLFEKCENFYSEIYVDIDSTSPSLDYINGYNTIIETIPEINSTSPTGKIYYLVSDRNFPASEINVSGKIVDLLTYKQRQIKSKPKNIIFDDFSDIDIDSSKTIKGIKLLLNNKSIGEVGDIYSNKISLPFKELRFKEIDGTPKLIYNTVDNPSYNPYFYGSYDDNYVSGTKNIDSEIVEGINIYGNTLDLWELSDLKNYYPIINLDGGYTGFNPDDYDIENIDAIKDKLRLLIDFSIKNSFNKSIQISDVEIVLYYSDYNETCTWYNGTFEKGLWVNGTFENGNMVSAQIFEMDFKNGNIGFELNDNRKI